MDISREYELDVMETTLEQARAVYNEVKSAQHLLLPRNGADVSDARRQRQLKLFEMMG